MPRFRRFSTRLLALLVGLLVAVLTTTYLFVVRANRAAFDACVERRQYQSVIKDAIDEAARYGIKSVPSFLVNGRLAPDPPPFLPPFDFLKRVVEEELSRQTRKQRRCKSGRDHLASHREVHRDDIMRNGRRADGSTVIWSEVARHYLDLCAACFPQLTETPL